jgi:hypothetical protein
LGLRAQLIKAAFRLEWLTVGWMEAAITCTISASPSRSINARR